MIAGLIEVANCFKKKADDAIKANYFTRSKQSIVDATNDPWITKQMILAREDLLAYDKERCREKLRNVSTQSPELAFRAFKAAALSDDKAMRDIGLYGFGILKDRRAVSILIELNKKTNGNYEYPAEILLRFAEDGLLDATNGKAVAITLLDSLLYNSSTVKYSYAGKFLSLAAKSNIMDNFLGPVMISISSSGDRRFILPIHKYTLPSFQHSHSNRLRKDCA